MKSIFTILFFLFCNSLLIAQSVPSSILISNQNTNSIKEYDISGKYIETPFSQSLQNGEHQFIWDANHLPTGAYFYKIITNERTYSGKLVIE